MQTRLRELRARRNWTQQECADRLGVSRQTINALERGRFEPTLRLALRIGRLFELPVEEIFSDEDARHAANG